MTAFTLRVYGEPAPQGSKKCFCRNGRATVVESSSDRVKAWREVVRFAFAAVAEQYDGPVAVDIEFILPRPKALRAVDSTVHTKRPDLDKLLRATLDALTDANVWNDDSQVVNVITAKRYAEPDEESGARITVETVG